MKEIKNLIKAVIECAVIFLGVMLIIHRHVFSAFLTGGPMPEAPEWHKKCFACHRK